MLKSFKTGECVQPSFGLCGRCNAIHADRDVDGEAFGNCIPCQAELVESVLLRRLRLRAEGRASPEKAIC